MKNTSKRRKIVVHHNLINGCSTTMLDSITKAQISELAAIGVSIREISRRLGVSRQSVRKYLTVETHENTSNASIQVLRIISNKTKTL